MKKDLISIALCTYNGEKYLRQQLTSIIMQTYKNLEIIIVDDCSTDQSLNIIIEYANVDSRIRWYKNEKNLGFNENFQRAFGLCRGTLISISDQDDIWEPEKIEHLADAIGDHWMVCSNSILINEEGRPTGNKLMNYLNFLKGDYRSILLVNFVTGHTSLMKSHFAQKCLPLPKNVMYDWWIGFVALYHNQLIYLDETLTRYRIHIESAVQQFCNPTINEEDEIDQFYYTGHLAHLDTFSRYSKIKAEDADFIRTLYRGYQTKGTEEDQTDFIELLNKYYTELFPMQVPRTESERTEFLKDYARKVPNVMNMSEDAQRRYFKLINND